MQLIQFFVAWIALGLVLVSSHVAAQSKPVQPKSGGKIVFGSLKDITTTNPFVNPYSFDYDARSLMFEGLTGLDNHGAVLPALAKSWTVSKDGLTYTFSLRSGVKFHSGKPLSSEDVKWSVEYLTNPKNRAYYMEQFSDVKSVETPDSSTAVFTLKRPFSPLLTVVSTAKAPILPAGSTFSPSAFAPGTGPFRFVEWQSGHHLTLAAFKDYWVPGIPYLSEITFKPIPDETVRITALKAKEVDIADELPYPVVTEAKKGKTEFNVVTHEAGVRRRMVFNTRIPPFNDLKLRQALAFAIDKKELAAGQTWGFAKPTNQRYPENSFWFVDVKDRDHDLQKAKALLQEAGYKEGFKIKVPVYPGPDMELTTIVKDQLKRVGIDMELDVMDWAAHTKVRNNRQFTLYSAGMGGRPDPDQVYYADVYSKSTNNDSGYSNPEVDQLLEKARVVIDPKERKKLYAEVVKFLQRDVPEIYLYLGPKFLGVSPRVKGFSTAGLEERLVFMGGGLPYTYVEQ